MWKKKLEKSLFCYFKGILFLHSLHYHHYGFIASSQITALSYRKHSQIQVWLNAEVNLIWECLCALIHATRKSTPLSLLNKVLHSVEQFYGRLFLPQGRPQTESQKMIQIKMNSSLTTC